jgi:NitT/TauT family transport system ATP-binding protein
MSVLRIGFLPLVDAVLPIVAHGFGLAEREGLTLELVRDPSWAAVRDRLAYGQTDAAHLLAPLAIATDMGLDRPPVPLAAPFMLGLNGNTVTLSTRVAAELGAGENGGYGDVADTGRRLAALAKREAAAGRRLRLAVVHRFSSHNYMLRYWLAACGCDPDHDVEIVVVPPPYISEAFALEEIDGSCVGEPWNSVAVEQGHGVIVAATSQIWNRGVEKLLAFRRDRLEARREEVEALVRALHAAGKIVADPARKPEVADLLSRPEYVGQPAALIMRALSAQLTLGDGTAVRDFLVLHREAANFPWRSQAMWLYSQMVRWGHAPLTEDGFERAASVFRPDVYRAALAGTDAILPNASAKVEGAIQEPLGVGSVKGRLIMGPDRFFDGGQFDPDRAGEYVEGQGR